MMKKLFIFNNFLFKICNANKDFNIKDLKNKIIEDIKNKVGNDEVLMGTSGGVDSTVAAYLVHKAIGKRLHCIFIDHGLIRKGEALEVKNSYQLN